jgi:signal transduction histidine kinase/CheY-like chemotaxis protein
MDCEKRIRELEAEIKRLRGATSQWNVIQKMLQESNRKLRETEEKLKEALIKAEAGTRAKSVFLANMSHEIRTPLNGIIGMADILRQTNLSEEQREYLNIIINSSDNLLQIINDILDFSKIEAGKMELESIKINIDDIVANVANLLLTKAVAKNIELVTYVDAAIPKYLRGDPVRIQQVILNLANNALKFTEKGEVYIGVEAGKISGNQLEIKVEVRDTGIGISEENQKKLFKSFSQTDSSTTRKYGGTGLGLAISKKLVEQMGGSIGVKSKEGQGTTFFFNIIAGICDEQPESIENNNTHKQRILAVDDNKTNVKILRKYLEFAKYDSLVIDKPEEVIPALQKAAGEQRPFSIVLLDYQMPVMDGVDVARKIRSTSDFKNVKLILLSSLAVREINQEGIRNIFNATLTKPVKFKALLDTIEDVSGLKQNEKTGDNTKENKIYDISVLIVDDNKINLKVAEAIMSKFVRNIDLAENGKQAAEMESQNHYDLIFMDMVMPVLDGIAATKKIRETGDNVTIIAMTANAMQDDINLCLDSGMNGFIAKPYRIQEIKQVIEEYGEKSGVD